MDDEIIDDESLVDVRLKAAARTAMSVSRRRLLLPAVPPRHGVRDWTLQHRTVLALVAVNAVVAAAAFAAGFGLRSSHEHEATPAASPSPSGRPTLSIGATVPVDVTLDKEPTSVAAGPDGSVCLDGVVRTDGNILGVDEATGATSATITFV